MNAKFSWLILCLGAVLLASCSMVTPPPPGDFNISTQGAVYAVNGVPRPELTLTRGVTYTFSVNASMHPFIITKDPTGGPLAPEDVDGVTNSKVEVGILTFTPDASTQDTVYYQCKMHTDMGNKIHIVG